MTELNIKNYFTRFLSDVSPLVRLAQDIYKEAQLIRVMKNGEYLMEWTDKR